MSKNDRILNTIAPSKTIIPLKEKDLQDSVVEIKFLATSWLDDFEKQIFDGKTVRQIINPQRYE